MIQGREELTRKSSSLECLTIEQDFVVNSIRIEWIHAFRLMFEVEVENADGDVTKQED